MRQRFTNKLMMICPANIKDFANAAAVQTMGAGNERTFFVGYSADGNAPATHYVMHSQMTDSFVNTLIALSTTFPTIKAWVSGTADFTPLMSLAQVTIVDEVTPQTILNSEGLKIVQ